MSVVDANIILRYVLDDHTELSPKAAAILEQHEVTLPIEAACEVVYVLQKVYKVERQAIRQHLSALLNENLISMDKPTVFLKALEYYSETTFDFVDTMLWAYHTTEQQEVFTFDSKLHNRIQRSV